MARFGDLDTQYFDASGDPLVNGKIYFYESGTTTPKTTYADVNNAIPNSNPVLLDASGRQPNIFFEGVAKATLTNNSDVQIVSRDPVGETATNFGDEWVSTRIYGANDVVIGSDGQYYRSLLAGNQNNNPATTSGCSYQCRASASFSPYSAEKRCCLASGNSGRVFLTAST